MEGRFADCGCGLVGGTREARAREELASLAFLVKGRSRRLPPPTRQGHEAGNADSRGRKQDHRRGGGSSQHSLPARPKGKVHIRADDGTGGDVWSAQGEGYAVLEPGVELAILTGDVPVGWIQSSLGIGRAKDHVVRLAPREGCHSLVGVAEVGGGAATPVAGLQRIGSAGSLVGGDAEIGDLPSRVHSDEVSRVACQRKASKGVGGGAGSER